MTACPLNCMHAGVCKEHEHTGEYYCDCPIAEGSGLYGHLCESSYRDCTDGDKRSWRCLNGGRCWTSGTEGGCACSDGFVGRFCATQQKSVAAHASESQGRPSVGWTVGITFEVVVATLLVFSLGYITGRRQQKNQIMVGEEEESESSTRPIGETELN